MERMKLFFVPRTRATRPLWLLEELAERGGPIDYELVRLDVKAGANRAPEYLAIHPHGHVPALLDGGQAVFESAAICLHLADRFIERGLAPPFGSSERARYYQWVAYNLATIEPPIGEFARHTAQLPEAERVSRLADKARARFGEVKAVLAGALENAPFLLGDHFSTADVLVCGNLNWARRLGLLDDHPALAAYVDRLLDRPAARRAYAAT